MMDNEIKKAEGYMYNGRYYDTKKDAEDAKLFDLRTKKVDDKVEMFIDENRINMRISHSNDLIRFFNAHLDDLYEIMTDMKNVKINENDV